MCQIDSGATCNILPKSYLDRIGGPPLQPSKSVMHMYNGDSVKPVGVVDLVCRRNGHQLTLQFQVVDGIPNKPPLICGSDCEILELINISADEIHAASHTTETSSMTAQDVMTQYDDVFHGLGNIGDPVHIELDDQIRPVQTGIRRYPVTKEPAISSRIKEMIDDGYLARVTEPTPWCSPMTAVDRPNKKLRICMDPVRTLNTAIKRPLYPMPTLEENLHHLVNAKCFTLADALVGFSQVKLDTESSLLTTMHTPTGRVRWLRLPFGISSAPEEFQRRQREVLEGLRGVINIADDILVFGSGNSQKEADQDHDTNLLALLNRCRERNLKLNPDKFKFRLREVSFMGHRITDHGLIVDQSKVDAVINMPTPEDKKATQRFIGMCNFLAQFIPKLSGKCSALREISNSTAEFSWSSTQQTAFDDIKSHVASACALQYFNPKLPVTLQVDASEFGLGAALLQNGSPVAYSSSTLTQCEKDNFAQIEKECLAIVHAMMRWDQWLYGHNDILVESDHKPLETIFKRPISQAPKRLQKMMLRLQRYSFKVQHRKGSTMWLADTLSRAPLPREHKPCAEFDVFTADTCETANKPDRILDHTFKLIQLATAADPVLSHLAPYIQHGWPDDKSTVGTMLEAYWTFRSELTVVDGVLYKGSKLVIPSVMRPRMLEKIHSAHQGIEKSILNATDILFWPSMRNDIQRACEECSVCAQYAAKHQTEPMRSQPTPELPWQFVSQDLFKYGTTSYLVTVDHYSDFFEMDALPDTLTSTVVNATKKHFARYGSPMCCLTDNGPQFVSHEYDKFAKDWCFKHVTSSPYHSQGNGRAEAAVKSAKSLLKKCKDADLGMLHLRNTPNKGHTSSPCQRLFSRRTRTTLPVAKDLLRPVTINSDIVQQEMQKQNTSAKYYYDRSAGQPIPSMSVGDYVYVRPPPTQHNVPWKYGTIIDKPAPRSYTVQTNSGVARRNRTQLRIAAPPPAGSHATGVQQVPPTFSVPELLPALPLAPSAEPSVVPQTFGGPPIEPVVPATSPIKPLSPVPVGIQGSPYYQTRSGRCSKPPTRYE